MTAGPMEPLVVTGRLSRLRALFATTGPDQTSIDALLVTTPANIRWLSGFTGSAGLLLVTPSRALLTTDGRYRTQASEQLSASGADIEIDITIGGVQAQRDALADAAPGAGTVGLEADHISWSAQLAWDGILADADLAPTHAVVEGLRAVKDAAEVARMQRAAAIADGALASVLPLLASPGSSGPGGGALTEAAFAAALDHAMRVGGAEESAFETIVASGENSAKPHARPGSRRIAVGDPVVVDFGATYDGYRSDMTRTFCIGEEPSGTLGTVFQVVTEAQRAGVATVGPDVEAGDVDRACREVIAGSGWADRFEHGTGHGVGLDIHERPAVGPGSTAILVAGTVVTVEPGVYLPGTGGVRIEDTLVVTEDGCRSLTQFPKEVAV